MKLLRALLLLRENIAPPHARFFALLVAVLCCGWSPRLIAVESATFSRHDLPRVFDTIPPDGRVAELVTSLPQDQAWPVCKEPRRSEVGWFRSFAAAVADFVKLNLAAQAAPVCFGGCSGHWMSAEPFYACFPSGCPHYYCLSNPIEAEYWMGCEDCYEVGGYCDGCYADRVCINP